MSDISPARPIAYLCPNRQLHVTGTDGKSRAQTLDLSLMWGSFTQESDHPKYSWPTWSPSGGHIACFQIHSDPKVSVLLLEVNGIQAQVLLELTEQLPIYLNWHAKGHQLAVLTQQLAVQPARLSLSVMDPKQPSLEEKLGQGSPLFFTWAGERIGAFVGKPNSQGNHLTLYDPSGTQPAHTLPGNPRNFCAPVWDGSGVIYVSYQGDQAAIVRASQDTATPEVLCQVEGLVALVGSPDKTKVAFATAPRGDGTPYQGLWYLDLEQRTHAQVHDDPCLAFFWTPDSKRLLHTTIDTDRNLLSWSLTPLGSSPEPIADTYPSRDFTFYLRFFEQYSQSHLMVLNNGFLTSGGVDGYGNPYEDPGIWQIPFSGGQASKLQDGVFGVYSPQPG